MRVVRMMMIVVREMRLIMKVMMMVVSFKGDEADNAGDDGGGEGVKADEGDKSDDWLQVQQKHVDEEQLAKVISQKLLERPGVSFSEIASVALEHGRKQLAVKVSSL